MAEPDRSFLFNTLLAVALPVELPKGSALFRAGGPAEAVYLVHKGRVVLRWEVESNLRFFDTAASGEIIGLAAAFNGSYSATARAEEESLLGYVPLTALNDLLNRNPDLVRAVTQLIAHQVVRARTAASSW
jgi:CRP-like cAMP-binding protein